MNVVVIVCCLYGSQDLLQVSVSNSIMILTYACSSINVRASQQLKDYAFCSSTYELWCLFIASKVSCN
jgi:hypothetical protein